MRVIVLDIFPLLSFHFLSTYMSDTLSVIRQTYETLTALYPFLRWNTAHINHCGFRNFFFLIFISTLFYFTILYWFLPYIDMNPPWVYMCSPSWTAPPTFLPIPSLRVIPMHQPQAPCIMHQTWTGDFVSHMIIYMFQCHSPKSYHPPLPSPTESKRLFCTSVSLLLSRIQGYHYHLSKFHIYVLVDAVSERHHLSFW